MFILWIYCKYSLSFSTCFCSNECTLTVLFPLAVTVKQTSGFRFCRFSEPQWETQTLKSSMPERSQDGCSAVGDEHVFAARRHGWWSLMGFYKNHQKAEQDGFIQRRSVFHDGDDSRVKTTPNPEVRPQSLRLEWVQSFYERSFWCLRLGFVLDVCGSRRLLLNACR